MNAVAGDNACIAQRLREMGQLVEAQGGNPFRAAAYRHAADTLARLPRDVRELFQHEGDPGLQALPGVGPRIAAAIGEMLATGAWGQLQRLRGEADPETLLRTVPGIGAGLAHRLHEALGVETLEALEVAAHDGRLERVPHVGARRAAAIRAALAQMLGRVHAARRKVALPGGGSSGNRVPGCTILGSRNASRVSSYRVQNHSGAKPAWCRGSSWRSRWTAGAGSRARWLRPARAR